MKLTDYSNTNHAYASHEYVNPRESVDGKDEKDLAIVFDNESFIRHTIKLDAEKGYELLFKKYYPQLCNHAVRFVYSKEIAEDIVSDLFVNLWRKKHYENITTSYRAYLYQSLRNTILNYLKSDFGKRNKAVAEISKTEEDISELHNPQKILLFDELFQKIQEVVQDFPPQCRKVFLLSRFEGRKNKEIAEDLGIKLKTVEAHIMKALGILRSSLDSYIK